MAKVNKIVGDRDSSVQLRHLASEIERFDISTQAARSTVTGRDMLRILAVRVTARQDHGQACACVVL
eukprot:5616052-Pyramimonas_sp.AAC.1